MNQSLRNLFRKHGAKVALYLVIGLILIDTLLTFRYKMEMNQNVDAQNKLNEIAEHKGTIISDLNNIDMSLRGFLLVGNEAFVGTYEKIKSHNGPTMAYLEANLPPIGIPVTSLSNMKKMLSQYFDLMDEAISLTRAGNKDAALKIIKEDHGTQVWETYMALSGIVDPVIQEKKAEAQNSYNTLLNMSLIFQFILFGIGVPVLIYTIINLTRTQTKRANLFTLLDQQNRKLIFDSNHPTDFDDENYVINDIITNLNKSANFIKGIAQGNYEVKWEGFSNADSEINKHNISGELLLMREGMKRRQEESVRQQWVSEGLNKVAEIIRDYQTNFEMLCQHTLSFMIKYLQAQQGGLFVLNDENEEDKYIELVSCYAFDKKKYVTKRVEIGEGVLGQIFLEGEPVYLTEVPKDYVTITSGLGELTPTVLTVYPMKQNQTVVALIEIASFTQIDQFSRDFLASACKSIAASIIALQSSVKTKILLEKAQQQTEELRSQEEEMRQNMEELEATQEEMRRREIAVK
ncbi:MAG: CHASE3 domain-containing protein [Chryseolinea sp.]